MKWIYFVGTLAVVTLFFWYQMAGKSGVPKPGEVAPAFSLPDQDGKMHSLSDYKGKWLVLYFYPKDDTPYCTKEACAFRDDFAKIKATGASIVGISLDDTTSHAKFAKKNHLPFSLLADTTGSTAREYGVLENLVLFKLARRYTFLIDPAGKIEKVYDKVQIYAHVNEVVSDLKRLAAG